MNIYVGIDDTDNVESGKGTGKLARGIENILPTGTRMICAVRQQLLLDDRVPYTSHNSSACVILDSVDGVTGKLIECLTAYIKAESSEGSDPGLCVAKENDPVLKELAMFGYECTRRLVAQQEATAAAAGLHLSGHGGTNDGIIGAAAAVGLTSAGWTGRYIELGRLRDFGKLVRVSELAEKGIRIVSVDRKSTVPAPDDTVDTRNWLRPRLLAHQPVLFVLPCGKNRWHTIDEKK